MFYYDAGGTRQYVCFDYCDTAKLYVIMCETHSLRASTPTSANSKRLGGGCDLAVACSTGIAIKEASPLRPLHLSDEGRFRQTAAPLAESSPRQEDATYRALQPILCKLGCAVRLNSCVNSVRYCAWLQ